jgi:hypothetical protein
MTRSMLLLVTAAAIMAAPVLAQTQPYGGYRDRPIKALSADEIAGLRTGQGMAMALPAELNRYPGPRHALDHAAALGLTDEQVASLRDQFETMRASAIAIGERIIVEEGRLDELFRTVAADGAAIDRLTGEIAALHGKLRAVHLRTHLSTPNVSSRASAAFEKSSRASLAGSQSFEPAVAVSIPAAQLLTFPKPSDVMVHPISQAAGSPSGSRRPKPPSRSG